MATIAKTVRTKFGAISTAHPKLKISINSRTFGIQIDSTLGLTNPLECPINTERWPGGPLYFFDGFRKPRKWNGYQDQVVDVELETPSAAPTLAFSGSGTITGDYKAVCQFVDEEGNLGPLGAVVATAVTASSDAQADYSALPVPTDPRIKKRRIYRTTGDQETEYYLDIESTDVFQATATSTKSDTDLFSQEAIALFNEAGEDLSSLYDGPRNDKPIVRTHRARLWCAGELIYSDGHAEVTNLSTTVTGRGTNWTAQFADRDFIVPGHHQRYTVSSVSEANQTITLDTPYRGATDKFSPYQIRPVRAQRTALYFSESAKPDNFLSTSVAELIEVSDTITALIDAESFMYVAFDDALYRYTFDAFPFDDGSFHFFSDRGCVNDRCWVRLDDKLYVLDRLGVYVLDGGQTQELAEPIRDLFSPQLQSEYEHHMPGAKDRDGKDAMTLKSGYKINWKRSCWFHACADRITRIVRFFVCLSSGLPYHAICYDTTRQQWWIEDYPWPVTASTSTSQAGEKPIVGGPGMLLGALGEGKLERLNDSGYVTRGTASSATLTSITVPSLVLPTKGVVGSTVAITKGTGKGQIRLIDKWTSATGLIDVQQPWLIIPDSTSEVQIGAIPWKWRSGWHRETGQNAPVNVQWTQAKKPSTFYIVTITPGKPVPPEQQETLTQDTDPYFYEKDDNEVMIKADHYSRFYQYIHPQVWDERPKEADYFAIEIGGFSGADGTIIHAVTVGGTA